jgi:hypothetical protein
MDTLQLMHPKSSTEIHSNGAAKIIVDLRAYLEAHKSGGAYDLNSIDSVRWR